MRQRVVQLFYHNLWASFSIFSELLSLKMRENIQIFSRFTFFPIFKTGCSSLSKDWLAFVFHMPCWHISEYHIFPYFNVLFVWMFLLHIPVNNFSGMSARLEPVKKQRIKCLAHQHNTVPPTTLTLATVRSQVRVHTGKFEFVFCLI